MKLLFALIESAEELVFDALQKNVADTFLMGAVKLKLEHAACSVFVVVIFMLPDAKYFSIFGKERLAHLVSRAYLKSVHPTYVEKLPVRYALSKAISCGKLIVLSKELPEM
jgi:hypothetical protein